MKNQTVDCKNLSNVDQYDFELDDSDDADISEGNNSQEDSLNNLAMLSSFGAQNTNDNIDISHYQIFRRVRQN